MRLSRLADEGNLMRHALIIDAAMMLSRSFEDLLVTLGFTSLEHCWNAEQAAAAARRHFPELVVLGGGTNIARALETVQSVANGRSLMVLNLTNPSPKVEPLTAPGAPPYDIA